MGHSYKGAGLCAVIKWFLCTTTFGLWEFTLTLTLFQFWIPPDYQLLFAYTSFKCTLSKALFLVETTGSVANQKRPFPNPILSETVCWWGDNQSHHRLHPAFQYTHVFIKNNLGLIVVLQPTIPKTIYDWSGKLIYNKMAEKAQATKTKWLDQRKGEGFRSYQD